MLDACTRIMKIIVHPPTRMGKTISQRLRSALPLLVLSVLIVGCGSSSTSPGGQFVLSGVFTEEEAVLIEDSSETTLRMVGVRFQTSGRTPTPESMEILAKFKQVFTNMSGVTYSVESHTDSPGSAAYNKRLTENRANTVRDYFVDELGGPEAAIAAVGWGEERPIASNNTLEGRAANRRLEIIIRPVK